MKLRVAKKIVWSDWNAGLDAMPPLIAAAKEAKEALEAFEHGCERQVIQPGVGARLQAAIEEADKELC